MQTVSSKEYPQRASVHCGSPSPAQTSFSNPLDLFKKGDGVRFIYPGEVKEMTETATGIRLCCSCLVKSNHLVYTHETSLFQLQPEETQEGSFFVDIDIWSDHIFRMRYSLNGLYDDHYQGLPADCRMLIGSPSAVQWQTQDTDGQIILRTASINVCIDKKLFSITARRPDGSIYFQQRRNDLFTSDIGDISVSQTAGETACFEAVQLEYDEEIFGLGERFDGVARKGRQVDFHNKDAIGTTSPRTYVNIPFFLSTKGYGLFLNSSAHTEWDIGTADSSALGFGVLDSQMDYFVLHGDTPKEILKAYCGLTGFAPLPPLWSFGLWMSRNSYTSWNMVDDITAELRKHDIPCDVIHLDTAWFKEDWNCDLLFSEERFPEPEKHMAKYLQEGFKISLWQYNFIPPKPDNTHYREAVENGYLCKDADGNPYQLPETCKGSWVDDVIIDFSNPEARKWYAAKIEKLIKQGAGTIKTDFGEGIPEDACFESIEGRYFHNLYSLVYNYTVSKAIERVSGENIVWARSGTAGSQRFPLHWGGDSQCSFQALAGTLRAAISIGFSGIPFFSHDIGGFIGMPSEELYIRWAQFGLFSSHARCHGAGDNTFREPWRFGQRAAAIFRKYDKLRYSLMPYIYEEAKKCTQTGLPMVRGLYLEYPEDRNVRYIDDQYLFGDSLLIAPVLRPLSESTVRSLYLPKGEWVDYWTRQVHSSSGQWIDYTVDLEIMPIFVIKGTTIAYGNTETSLLKEGYSITRYEEF